MVYFQNITYDLFNEEYSDKKIICFGGGGTLRLFLELQQANIDLIRRLKVVINNDKCGADKDIKVQKFFLPIQSVDEFLKQDYALDEYVMLLLVSNENVLEVLHQLDEIKELEDMVCIYGIAALSWGREIFHPPLPVKPQLPHCNHLYEIPKIIHYCWFGNNKMTELNRECIESWKRHCPDFEIRFWNEDNYDISKTPLYVQQAYKAGKYAFVSDYARLDIIYQMGGFYFDTDVELYRSIDEFIHYKSVYAFMEYSEVATGLGFGSVPYTDEIKDLRDMYEECEFINTDGTYNLTPCPLYTNYYFRKKGIRTNNELQFVDDILFLPSSYLCPMTPIMSDDGNYNLTLYSLAPNTYAIHKCDNTWKNEEEREAFQKTKEEYKKINKRLLNDWKRKYLEGMK